MEMKEPDVKAPDEEKKVEQPVQVEVQRETVRATCPNCGAVVGVPSGFSGKMKCGSCANTFTILPIASTIKPGHHKHLENYKPPEGEWQSGTYSCQKDIGVCCCVGVLYVFLSMSCTLSDNIQSGHLDSATNYGTWGAMPLNSHQARLPTIAHLSVMTT